MSTHPKWKLNNGKLLATAAAFRITKDDVMESQGGNDYSATGTANTGKNQVEGVEFGLSGNITDELSVQAGVAFMDAEVLEAVDEEDVGKTLANFADKSASVQLKYQATPKFAFGGTVTYESERFVGQPDSAANEERGVPEYTVLDAFASYKVNRDMTVRVNVNNVFDEDYYLTAYRSGGFAYKGDGRSGNVTVEYKF